MTAHRWRCSRSVSRTPAAGTVPPDQSAQGLAHSVHAAGSVQVPSSWHHSHAEAAERARYLALQLQARTEVLSWLAALTVNAYRVTCKWGIWLMAMDVVRLAELLCTFACSRVGATPTHCLGVTSPGQSSNPKVRQGSEDCWTYNLLLPMRTAIMCTLCRRMLLAFNGQVSFCRCATCTSPERLRHHLANQTGAGHDHYLWQLTVVQQAIRASRSMLYPSTFWQSQRCQALSFCRYSCRCTCASCVQENGKCHARH
jgi:hypothetical protein